MEVQINISSHTPATHSIRKRRPLALGLAVALLAFAIPASASATTPQLRSAKQAFESAYVQTIDTSGRLEGDLDQIITVCERARFTPSQQAREAIFRLVGTEAEQSAKRWRRWDAGLAQRLPPLANAIDRAKAGMSTASQADAIEAHSDLLDAIKLHRDQAEDAQIADARLEDHGCGAAKLQTRALAQKEDRGLDLYHKASRLIAEALARG